jgi:hypothetical protein
MGFKVPELTANSKAPLAEGKWEVRFVKFQSGESSVKKTPYVQAIFKVTDEDAVDTEGEPYKRNLYADTFYLTSNAMYRLKNFATLAEVEIPEAGDEYDSLAEYAADLTEAFSGLEGVVTVVHETYENKDGEEKVKAVVAEDGYDF